MGLFTPGAKEASFALLLDLLRGAGLILTVLLWIGLMVYFVMIYRQHHKPWVKRERQLATNAPKLWQIQLITDLLAEGCWFLLVSVMVQKLTNTIINGLLRDLARFEIWKDAVTLYAYPIAVDWWAIIGSLLLTLLFLYFTEVLGKRKVIEEL